jgi:hypothetical protein
MSAFPATNVKVVAIEPHGDTRVRIMMEMVIDVHRLSEVGSELLHAAVSQVKADQRKKKKVAG